MKGSILPILMIVLGLLEVAIGLMGFRLPAPVAFILGGLFIVFGIRTLKETGKKK